METLRERSSVVDGGGAMSGASPVIRRLTFGGGGRIWGWATRVSRC